MTKPQRRATVRDVAAAAGVSPSTVSRVLNGSDYVTPSTRDAVRTAIDELGMEAPARRSPGAARSRHVFVRCPYVLTDYFGLLVSSISEALAGENLAVILDAGLEAMDRHPLRSLMARTEIVGAILLLPPEQDAEIDRLRLSGLPFVIVDPRRPAVDDVAAVSATHALGARHIASHLLELGHRRIGVVGGPEGWLATDERSAGHASALAEHGLLQDPDLVTYTWPTYEDGAVAAGALLDRDDPPTALVCFNDNVAVGAYRAAAERGLRVPEDLSIAGFDDLPIAEMLTPPLTTVRQPLAEMARMSVSLLGRLLEGSAVDALHVALATRLVPRGSTAEPRKA